MELPYIFDGFFDETSLWFVIFMLVSFLIGFFTAWWMRGRTVRILRRKLMERKPEAARED